MGCKTIHITGASGSGTTTFAKFICDKYGYAHLDTDDFFWEPIDPPFTIKRERIERQCLMLEAIEKAEKCVISGSMTGWGDRFIPRFDLVVYLYTPVEIRLKRLRYYAQGNCNDMEIEFSPAETCIRIIRNLSNGQQLTILAV